jgi:hypothetical protein
VLQAIRLRQRKGNLLAAAESSQPAVSSSEEHLQSTAASTIGVFALLSMPNLAHAFPSPSVQVFLFMNVLSLCTNERRQGFTNMKPFVFFPLLATCPPAYA